MNQPTKINFSNIKSDVFDIFVQKLKDESNITLKKYNPITEKCHLIRCNYALGSEKFSIVYDTKARLVSIAALDHTMDKIRPIIKSLENGNNFASAVPNKTTERENSSVPPSLPTTSARQNGGNSKQKPLAVEDEKNKNKSIMNKKTTKNNNTQDKKPTTLNKPETNNHYIDYDYQSFVKQRELLLIAQRQQASKDSASKVLDDNQTAKKSNNGNQSLKNKQQKANSSQQQDLNDKKQKVSAVPSKVKSEPQQTQYADKDKIATKGKPTSIQANEKSLSQADVVKKPNILTIAEKATHEEALPEYKNGFSVKNITKAALDNILQHLNVNKKLKLVVLGTVSAGTANEIVTYSVTDSQKQKVFLRYMPAKNVLQLQGKRSNLFIEMQVIASHNSDYLSAVGTHISLIGHEQEAKQEAKSIQKKLKKAIPDAYDYLSEQSKIDFSIGLVDIGNDDVKLSDYSALLVPPYRGLERFIYDLQKAQGIDVKMIGQGFEKKDNLYVLKAGYFKKINSVIFNEVMSALYTEYFEKRNFYAHSNNSLENSSRVIQNKADAKHIFENLFDIINYNCKKLKEIGFSIR